MGFFGFRSSRLALNDLCLRIYALLSALRLSTGRQVQSETVENLSVLKSAIYNLQSEMI
jgi:hypothetical protein